MLCVPDLSFMGINGNAPIGFCDADSLPEISMILAASSRCVQCAKGSLLLLPTIVPLAESTNSLVLRLVWNVRAKENNLRV